MDNEAAQEDEILALKSIYEETDIFCYNESTRKGTFFVKISSTPPQLFNLNFVNEKLFNIKVEHLTPIQIEFELPKDYPSANPPIFSLSCRWLTHNNLSKVCQKFDELWSLNENQSILFTWISFLSDELFEFLDFNIEDLKINTVDESTSSDKRAIKLPCSSQLIKNFDKDEIEFKFQNSYFTCQVCFTDKSGKDCMRFHKCEHVFLQRMHERLL